jgi:hypothetical protein
MASKAKQSVSKKQKSFAAAVKGVKTPSVFAKTSCKLTMPPGYPHRRLPKPTMENSFFIDLRTTDASDMEVAEALDKKCKNIRGIHYRDDLRVVEVIFATKNEMESSLDAIAIPNRKPVYPTCRFDWQKMVYIKMANVPYGDEKELKKAIVEYWEEFGLVLDTAQHKVHGKWATRRWDLWLSVPKDEKIEAPVAFELLGASIVAEWPKSPPSCLICKKAGHQAKKCPSKIPKAGGCPNPEKKDLQVTPAKNGQEKTESEKTPKTGLEKVPPPKPKKTDQIGAESASVSVTASTSATVSETASVSVSASVEKSPDSNRAKIDSKISPTSEAADEEENMEQVAMEEEAEFQYPPLQVLEPRKTPRSDSGKRMSKTTGVSKTYINPGFDGEEVDLERFCGNCGCRHLNVDCEEFFPYDGEKAVKNMEDAYQSTVREMEAKFVAMSGGEGVRRSKRRKGRGKK